MTKTYTKQIEEACLVIENDDSTESPRQWSNLGYFITVDSKHYSPDRHEVLEQIIRDTSMDALSQDEHKDLITARIKEEMGEKVLAIYPVVKYEHGGVVYKLGTAHGFDYSNNGFYIITDKSIKDGDGVSPKGTKKQKEVYYENIIKGELESYNKYINGEVYGYTLYGTDGEIEDSCWGFYDIEDIREHLPKEYKTEDLTKYIK